MLPRKQPGFSRNSSGFSLIEAAIVLGIVGLVIGGIWIAASAVQDSLRMNNLINLVAAVRAEAQKLKPSYAALGYASQGTSYDLTPILATKSLPGGFSTNTTYHTLYNGQSVVRPGIVNSADGIFVYVGIMFKSNVGGNPSAPEPKLCAKIVSSLLNGSRLAPIQYNNVITAISNLDSTVAGGMNAGSYEFFNGDPASFGGVNVTGKANLSPTSAASWCADAYQMYIMYPL